MEPETRLRISIVALIAVYFIGVFGFIMIQGLDLLDAMYFTAITLTTVGYEVPFTLTPLGKVWTISVITIGIATVSVAFTSLVALFVGGEIRAVLGTRRMESKIDKLDHHVIVCGYGRMGRLVTTSLKRDGQEVVVVERSADRLAQRDEHGLLYVNGDATEEEVLQRAGLNRARALVAALPSDADNVFVTVTARALRPDAVIIARSEQPQTESKLKRAGATRVVCPQSIGATQVTHMITRPHVVDFFEVASQGVELEMEQFTIARNSTLAGQKLKEIDLRKRCDVVVVAIRAESGDTQYNPSTEAEVSVGDSLIMIGPAGISKRLRDISLLKEDSDGDGLDDL